MMAINCGVKITLMVCKVHVKETTEHYLSCLLRIDRELKYFKLKKAAGLCHFLATCKG